MDGDGSGSGTRDPEQVSLLADPSPGCTTCCCACGLRPAPCVLDHLHLFSGSCGPRATPPASQLLFCGRCSIGIASTAPPLLSGADGGQPHAPRHQVLTPSSSAFPGHGGVWLGCCPPPKALLRLMQSGAILAASSSLHHSGSCACSVPFHDFGYPRSTILLEFPEMNNS